MATQPKQSKQFQLGEQPEWAGRGKNINLPTSFIKKLLAENNSYSLINRGYCIVKLDPKTREHYSLFHKLIKHFFQLNIQKKQKYALLQFDPMNGSPNQCHGYSAVSNLKEQFMMRCIGNNIDNKNQKIYIFPNKNDDNCTNFGEYGMKIFEVLDLKCRELAKNVMIKLNKNPQSVDDILDPIHKINQNIIKTDTNSYSLYMPNNYISSSIMDNFHYFPPSHQKHKKFYNNHASHTDSGLMTAVIITDEPGLEVYDQKMNEWIFLEELMRKYLKEKDEYKNDKLCHRNYATFFWSDSVEYLNNAPIINGSSKNGVTKIKALFHRVADCKNERYSVVFKQRTAPLRTHCRYQEDYILASLQQKVDTQSKNAYTLWDNDKQKKKKESNNEILIYAIFALLALSAVFMYFYK